jgi:hypothetical protein
VEKVAQMWATSVFFLKKCPKVNNHPMGKNSSNLVTLFKRQKGEADPRKAKQENYIQMHNWSGFLKKSSVKIRKLFVQEKRQEDFKVVTALEPEPLIR